ncbi:MAG: hypothetical protein AAGJ46_05530 [Planctomycetota bacterium]
MTSRYTRVCRFAITAAVAALPLLFLPEHVQAEDENLPTRSFSIGISSSLPKLMAPDDPAVKHIESWDSPLMRIINRSRPYIEVRNTSTIETANITEFSMTIGDIAYDFGDSVLGAFAVVSQYSAEGLTVDSISSPTNGDDIRIAFGGDGLAPGEVVRFQVDIDPETSTQFIHPDFRTVFFDLEENGDADNSVMTATFENGRPISVRLQDLNLPPGTVGSTVFANSVRRPYDVMEDIELVTDGGEVVIPEPSAAILVLLATAGGLAVRMRHRLG